MSSSNKRYLNEYRDYKKGLREANKRDLYIDSVAKYYGSDFAKAFNTEVYDLIIRMDSFFANISSLDAAEILKKAEIVSGTDLKETTILKRTFDSFDKYTYSEKDYKRVRPKYKDEKLCGQFGLNKGH